MFKKISGKLMIFGGILVFFNIAIALFAVINLNTLGHAVEESYHETLMPISWVKGVGLNNMEIESLLLRAKDATNLEEIRLVKEQVAEVSGMNNVLLELYEKTISSETEEQLFLSWMESRSGSRQNRDKIFEAFEGDNFEKGRELIDTAVSINDDVQMKQSEVIEYLENYGEKNAESNLQLVSSISSLIIGIIIGVIIISVILTISMTKSITKPINIMRTKLSQMASGDLTVEIPTHYKAEFGEMFESFRNMLGNLNILISNAKGTSSDIQGVFYTVADTLEEVKGNVAIIDGHVQTLSTVAESQVASLKESSVAMDNIASGIQQIAESSTSIVEVATETSTQASDGSEVIEKSVTQMETINQVVEDTSSVVDRLVRRTKTIDEALKAITGIAEQTNLLALNASIEAARAGEQGRGFAVVADEVSKLAAQSKESANEINTLLQEINEDTKEAVHAMEQGKMETKQGIEVIRQAGEAFSSIVEQINVVTEQVQEVSATVEEMSAGTEEVNASLADVVQNSEGIPRQAMKVMEQNNAEVEILGRMFAAVDDTKNNAAKLEEALNEFKTENGDK